MNTEIITSAQNAKIKKLLSLEEKSRVRRESGLFTVEGCREFRHCIEAGYKADTVFICPELFNGEAEEVLGLLDKDVRMEEVSREIYEKVAYRGGTEGIIGEFHAIDRALDDIRLSTTPLVIVLESVEKPGNLGAVIRSADAAGADAVIVCDPLTDMYNPNLIRSSIGGIFCVQCVSCTSEEAVGWLKAKGIQILTAQLQDSEWYYRTDMTGPTAIVIGTESTGLTDIWRNAADSHIRIPMCGMLDSLNASVSAAVLLFEAVRQRNA